MHNVCGVLKCRFKYYLFFIIIGVCLRDCKFIAVLLMTIVTASGIAGHVVYARTLTPKFEPYTAVFHLLFEDASHDLLGKLTGRLEIAQTNASTVVSTLTLAFSSERLNSWHEPYIDNVTLEIIFAVMFFESGAQFGIPLPPIQSQTLNNGEKAVFYERSHDISKLKQPMICIFCVFPSGQVSNVTKPSIQVYFSDGQVWRFNENIYPLWQDQYEYPPSAIDVKLSELSDKTETTTITLTTVASTRAIKMVFGFPVFTVIVFLLLIMLIIAIYLLYSARKSKNARAKEFNVDTQRRFVRTQL